MTRARRMAMAVGVAVMLPGAAAAQSPGAGEWWEWALPAVAGGEAIRTSSGAIVLPWPREGRGGRDYGRDRWDRQGPKFCRNGEGHPVHGRRWCAEKGFGGYSIWRRVGWGDVVLRGPRRRGDTLRRGALIEVLGDIVFGRLDAAAREAGGGPLDGRWLRADPYGGRVLQVRAGGVPVAELTDLDGDARVDAVLLRAGR